MAVEGREPWYVPVHVTSEHTTEATKIGRPIREAIRASKGWAFFSVRKQAIKIRRQAIPVGTQQAAKNGHGRKSIAVGTTGEGRLSVYGAWSPRHGERFSDGRRVLVEPKEALSGNFSTMPIVGGASPKGVTLFDAPTKDSPIPSEGVSASPSNVPISLALA